ncbi:MAG: hypothetical protein V4484_03970 [Pseudomonadota bacterium]
MDEQLSGWKLWGGACVALVVVFAGAMWLFDEHNHALSASVIARAQLAAVEPVAIAAVAAHTDHLPPLVLLAREAAPVPVKKVAKPLPVSAIKLAKTPKRAHPKLMAKARVKPKTKRA